MTNDALRAAVAADLHPVRPLAPPVRRALPVVPLAVVLLLAAPLAFSFRDLAPLGWAWSWGASIAQMLVAIWVIALALADAVPGRVRHGLRAWIAIALAVLLFGLITAGAWAASPVPLDRLRWRIGVLCVVGAAVSALPAVVMTTVLIARAFPLQPARAGALAGLGAGLMADAGWRLFCHFSEPAHVIAAHAGGIALAVLTGAVLTTRLVRR